MEKWEAYELVGRIRNSQVRVRLDNTTEVVAQMTATHVYDTKSENGWYVTLTMEGMWPVVTKEEIGFGEKPWYLQTIYPEGPVDTGTCGGCGAYGGVGFTHTRHGTECGTFV